MGYNIPAFDTTRLSFGPGIVYIGPAGSTPTVDIGSVQTGQLTIERKTIKVMQGSPQTQIKQYCVEEDVIFKVTGLEWNTSNLAYFLGAGVTTQSGATEQLDMGGDYNFSQRALRFLHIMPDGGTIDLHLFNAYSSGKVQLDFKDKANHELILEFTAIDNDKDFQNASTAANKKRFRLLRTKA